MRQLEFYTDGAFSSRTEMGGWGAICVENNIIIDKQSGYEPYSTNNRMELTAFLSALENIDTIETTQTKVIIYTDSAYIANCINQKWYSNWMSNGWRTSDRQSVKNQDLWTRIVALYIKNNARFKMEVIKVKSHSDNLYNEMADKLAVAARKKLEVED